MDAPCILYAPAAPGDAIVEAEVAGVRRFAAARGWEVRPVAADTPATMRDAIRRVRPLGCIVNLSNDRRDLPPSLFRGLPLVYVHPPHAMRRRGVPFVARDNEAIARFAFRELASGRPDAFAFVGSRYNRAWSRERERAFRSLAEAAGMPCAVFPPRPTEPDAPRAARLAAFAASLPRHAAVFCASDATGGEFLAACRTVRRAVPRDLAVVGADNVTALCERLRPSLTSVQVDSERTGYVAARMLAAAASGDAAADGAAVLIGPLLVVRRESTRGRGRREPRIAEAVAMIRAEACDGLDAATLAARFPGSRRLFEMRFREAMGHSVLDEILEVRLETAKSLLAHGKVSLSALAAFCGFSGYPALQKAFRSRTGLTMSAWRKRHFA